MIMRKSQGFTLIEVMIVVAIIGIIGTFAYPSYTEYVMRGHRADARGGLLQTQLWMERAATATGVYPETLPAELTWANDNSKHYTIRFLGDNSNAAFTLAAVPKAPQRNDRCGTLTLSHSGEQGVINQPAGSTISAADCWNR